MPILALLFLAFMPWSAQAAELHIGSAQGYPGDTVEITLSLQGDGATVSARFLIEPSWVANFATMPATVLVPGVTCEVEGSRFRVAWNGNANTSLVDICVIRMTIFNADPRFNQSIFGRTQQCLDAGLVEQPCSIVSGHIDVIHEIDRAFIAVLHDSPTAPSLQEVIEFDYADTNATPPLGFIGAARPQYVRASTIPLRPEHGSWLLENPNSPITRLYRQGARFTYATLEEREQALTAARNDPAVRDIVETLSLAGPERTYPVLPQENQPFGLYLVGPGCPLIDIATPESRSIQIVGQQIDIVLHSYYPGQVCFGAAHPGYSTAVVEIPGLAAGTYNVSIETDADQRTMELIVHPSGIAAVTPVQVPIPDLRLWLILGVLILAVTRLSTQAR